MLRAITAILLCVLPLNMSANAQSAPISTEKSAIRSGFAFPADGPVRILVFRPDVQVSEQSTGGLNQRNVEWTLAAKAAMMAALSKAQASQQNELKIMDELTGADADLMYDYRSLFKTVTDAVIVHKLFPGNRLPSKKDQFDWSLGKGASKLGQIGGGEYGLFFYTFDSYESSGRKAAQAVGQLFGVGVSTGVHIGYAGLVDLKTGDLVWINADIKMGGDVRTADGAEQRIKQLLHGFPSRSSDIAANKGE
jgi:hypothetical protein